MDKDKYKALWVSYSSISDFLACPRAYFLNNIYRNPLTGHKITLMKPSLALGQAVHQVIESLSVMPVDKRIKQPYLKLFEKSWQKVSGIRGGFKSKEQEKKFKKRGEQMIKRLQRNPGPLANLAIKINSDLPHYYLSKKENIILCGKIDWLEYLSDSDAIHIIDFKTGKNEEDKNSLQLPIYFLLAKNCQKREVKKISYWYLNFDDQPREQNLPDINEAEKKVISIAQKIKKIRQEKAFFCPKDGCFACEPLERIANGEGKFVGVDEYNQDVYVL